MVSVRMIIVPENCRDRVCPGRFFAEQGLWLTMASILAAFDIKPPLDDSGRECMPKIVFTTGTGR